MVRARALRSPAANGLPAVGLGPCDNKLKSLARGVATVVSAGKAVQVLSDIAWKYRVAKDLLHYYYADCCRMGQGMCHGRYQQRARLWNKWAASMEALHEMAVQEVEESLDSLPLSHSAAEHVKRSPPESVARGSDAGLRRLLVGTALKWKALEEQKSALHKARQTTQHRSQYMRAWLREQQDMLVTGCDANEDAPAEVVGLLHAATQAERIVEERVQSMANDLAIHLVKTHLELQAELARVAQYRQWAIQDAKHLPFLQIPAMPVEPVHQVQEAKIVLAGLRSESARDLKLRDLIAPRAEELPAAKEEDEEEVGSSAASTESMEAAMRAALEAAKEMAREVSSSANTESYEQSGADADTDVEADASVPQKIPAGFAAAKEHDDEKAKIVLAGLRAELARDLKLRDLIAPRAEELPAAKEEDKEEVGSSAASTESMEAAMRAALEASKEMAREVSSSANTDIFEPSGTGADVDTDVEADASVPQKIPAGFAAGKEHDEKALLLQVVRAASPSRQRG